MKRPRLGAHCRRSFYAACRCVVVPALTCLTLVRHFNVPDLGGLGGVLIASNHQSYLDPALVAMPLERPIHYLARRELFGVPGFGMLIRALGAHPVQRGAGDAAAFRQCLRLLRGGEALLVFPEGTRTWDGSLGPFKAGVGSLAVRCSVPVLPVCIEGAWRCWPRHRRLPGPARVAVAYGELMWPRGTDARWLTGALAARVASMQRELRCFLAGAAGAPKEVRPVRREDGEKRLNWSLEPLTDEFADG